MMCLAYWGYMGYTCAQTHLQVLKTYLKTNEDYGMLPDVYEKLGWKLVVATNCAVSQIYGLYRNYVQVLCPSQLKT